MLKIKKLFFILSLYLVFKVHCVFYTHKSSQFQLSAFQMLNCHVWLVATGLESTELDRMKNFKRWQLITLESLTHIEGTKGKNQRFGEDLWGGFLQRKLCCEFYSLYLGRGGTYCFLILNQMTRTTKDRGAVERDGIVL